MPAVLGSGYDCPAAVPVTVPDPPPLAPLMTPSLDALRARAARAGDDEAQRDSHAAANELVAIIEEAGPDADAAFTALCLSQTDRVFRYIQVRGVPPHDAEDLMWNGPVK
jgi:hypothetical protein